MFRFILAAAFVALVLGDCKPPDTDFHAFQCMDNPSVAVPPDSVSISPYPANPSFPIDMKFTYVNTYGEVDALKVDVTLEYFGNLLFHCGWHKIPIPIHNIDGCKVVDNCPLTKGTHANDLKVDLTPFAPIIKTLADNTYYRLNITVKDAAHMDPPISCVSTELLMK